MFKRHLTALLEIRFVELKYGARADRIEAPPR